MDSPGRSDIPLQKRWYPTRPPVRRCWKQDLEAREVILQSTGPAELVLGERPGRHVVCSRGLAVPLTNHFSQSFFAHVRCSIHYRLIKC
jgi:hypothetical protein